MKQLIREIPLDNGLTVRFFDATRRYFGDYHQVRIEIRCDVPLTPCLFQTGEEYQRALKLLGPTTSYVKNIEHQGIPTAAVDETVEKVIRHFTEHSLGYFTGDAFPKKLVQSELNRLTNRSRSFVSPRGIHG